MKIGEIPEFKAFNVRARSFALLSALIFLFIHRYDGKWNIPIIFWQIINLFAGPFLVKVLGCYIIACWLYIFSIVFTRNISLNFKVVGAFIGLYAIVLYSGYQQVSMHREFNVANEKWLFYTVPLILFTISSVLFFQSLKVSK